MRLAIMQPYFFPYIGYFQLINAVDKWVVFDEVQYIRHGWVNRNMILSPNIEKQWQYIIVSLQKHNQGELIKNIKVNYQLSWQESERLIRERNLGALKISWSLYPIRITITINSPQGEF